MVGAYAPALVELARLSLVQAQRTGRQDLTWERATLARAQSMGPGIPDASAELLHLALVSQDKAAIAAALTEGSGRAEPYPRWAEYAVQAQAILSAK